MLTGLMVLGGCATAGKLPWTAENVQAVGRKCQVSGIGVDSSVIWMSGLSAGGGVPSWKKKEDCLRRNIQLPANVLFVTG